MKLVRTPQINANEEEVEVVEVMVRSGDPVEKGQLLCVLESTKAAVELEAPHSGFVRKLQIESGDRVAVGDLICAITETADESVELPTQKPPPRRDGRFQVTRRASALIEQYGLDADEIGHQGILTEQDVLQFLQRDGRDLRSPKDRPEARSLRLEDSSRAAVVIYGAGGHARVIIDLIREGHRDLHIAGIVDDGRQRPDEVFGVPIVGDSNHLVELRERGVEMAALGVGAVTHNALRAELCERLRKLDFSLPNLIHPRATVEPSVRMGRGNQIFSGAVVSSNVELGDHTIVNSNAVISHDCRIGDHAHITPGALLAGGVEVGPRSVIGMGATVYLGVQIGGDVVIENGKNVLRDVTAT